MVFAKRRNQSTVAVRIALEGRECMLCLVRSMRHRGCWFLVTDYTTTVPPAMQVLLLVVRQTPSVRGQAEQTEETDKTKLASVLLVVLLMLLVVVVVVVLLLVAAPDR